jgi:hypothetical protein
MIASRGGSAVLNILSPKFELTCRTSAMWISSEAESGATVCRTSPSADTVAFLQHPTHTILLNNQTDFFFVKARHWYER